MTPRPHGVRRFGLLVVAVIIVAGRPAQSEAAIVRGIQEIVGGILSVPVSLLDGTLNGPPVIGTVIGAVSGLIGGVGLVAHGALELGVSAVSIAKTVAPYLLPFLL